MGRPDPGDLPWLEKLVYDFEKMRAAAAEEAKRKAWQARKLFDRGQGEPTDVHHSDLVQQGHRDCFLMSAVAALVQQHPDPDGWMKKVIQDNGNGTYTVTFYERSGTGYTAIPVTVSEELPRAATSDDGREKWPAIIEKAYGQQYGGAGDKPFDARGKLGEPMEHLTGIPSQVLDANRMTFDQLDKYLATGHAVTVQTFAVGTGMPHDVPTNHPAYQPGGLSEHNPERPTPLLPDTRHDEYNNQLRPWHEYYVHKVDRASGTVVLHNVWDDGRQDLKIPFDQFQTAMEAVRVNPVTPRAAAN